MSRLVLCIFILSILGYYGNHCLLCNYNWKTRKVEIHKYFSLFNFDVSISFFFLIRLLYGVDSEGNLCGINNPTRDLTGSTHLVFFDPLDPFNGFFFFLFFFC